MNLEIFDVTLNFKRDHKH